MSQGNNVKSAKAVAVAEIYYSTHKTCFSFIKILTSALMFTKCLKAQCQHRHYRNVHSCVPKAGVNAIKIQIRTYSAATL